MSGGQLDEDKLAERIPAVPRLVFNGVELVPFDEDPVQLPNAETRWRLPGGKAATTRELLRTAREYGVSLTIIINNQGNNHGTE